MIGTFGACPVCKRELLALFTSTYCPNNCGQADVRTVWRDVPAWRKQQLLQLTGRGLVWIDSLDLMARNGCKIELVVSATDVPLRVEQWLIGSEHAKPFVVYAISAP